jgi:hypothetical protein
MLPFPNDFFDGAFHFGGINLFEDISYQLVKWTELLNQAVELFSEMKVSRPG